MRSAPAPAMFAASSEANGRYARSASTRGFHAASPQFCPLRLNWSGGAPTLIRCAISAWSPHASALSRAAPRIIGERMPRAERGKQFPEDLQLDLAHRGVIDQRRIAERLQPRSKLVLAGHRDGLRAFAIVRHCRNIDIHRIEISP